MFRIIIILLVYHSTVGIIQNFSNKQINHNLFISQDEFNIFNMSKDLQTIPCISSLITQYAKVGQPLGGKLVLISVTSGSPFIQSYVLKSLNDNYEMSIMTKISNKFHYSPARVIDKARAYVMIVIDIYEIPAVHALFKSLPTYNLQAKMIVYFPLEMSHETFKREQKAAFQMIFEYGFMDVYIIGRKFGSTIIESYTFFPYENNNCAQKVQNIELVDECHFQLPDATIEDNLTFEDIYERSQEKQNIQKKTLRESHNKIPNVMEGCEITVTVSSRAPFVVIDEISKKSAGIELQMLEETFKQKGTKLRYRIQSEITRYMPTSLNNLTGVYADLLTR